jgi:hypothetical protein
MLVRILYAQNYDPTQPKKNENIVAFRCDPAFENPHHILISNLKSSIFTMDIRQPAYTQEEDHTQNLSHVEEQLIH